MSEILTYEELKGYNNSILNESTQIFKSAMYDEAEYKYYPKNVFLSYSSKDSELIPWIVKLLRGHGGNPYIDKGDKRLPETPSVETAKVLKDAIISCKRLIVFVTTNSKESRWIPWELGIGDGAKSNNDIAIFPTANSAYETKWLEQEYLGLYRRIVWGKLKGYDKNVWMVYNYRNNTATELNQWLSS